MQVRNLGMGFTAPSRSARREPIFQPSCPVEPGLRELPREVGWAQHAGVVAAPVAAIGLALLTNLHAEAIGVLTSLAGVTGWAGTMAAASFLDARSHRLQLENDAALRQHQAAGAQYQQAPARARPPSPWPRLESLVGQQAALKTLLSGPESAGLAMALANLADQGVQLGKTPAQLLECTPDRLATHAVLPEGKRVPLQSMRDLRRLDLAYGHSDPTAFSSALNSFLDAGYTVTPGLKVLPDSQSTQSRYEAFRLLECDQPATRQGGEMTLNLHADIVAQEYFQGSGQDHGLSDPGRAKGLKELYARDLCVFFYRDGVAQPCQGPLEAYRAVQNGYRVNLGRRAQDDSYRNLGIRLSEDPGADLARFNDWEKALGSPDEGQVARAMQSLGPLESSDFTPPVLLESLRRLQTCVRSGFSQELTEPLRQLRQKATSPEDLSGLVTDFLAEPRWVERDGMYNKREEVERHLQQCVDRVLMAHEVKQVAGGSGLQRGIQKLKDMVVVGSVRVRSR